MQSSFALCMGSSAFLIVDLTFHGQWYNAGTMQAPCSGKYDCLVSHPSLATVEVVKAKCYNRSSKLFLSFGPFEPRSQQQRRLCKNHDVGTASFQLPSSKTATK